MDLATKFKNLIKKYLPNDKKISAALMRIGHVLSSEIKSAIKKQGLIDTGALINSVKLQIYGNYGKHILEVGSYGIKYAAIHEFGGIIRPKKAKYLAIPLDRIKMRGMRPRDFTNTFVIPIRGNLFICQREGKDLKLLFILKKSVTIPKRPYLRPSFERRKKYIIEQLKRSIK